MAQDFDISKVARLARIELREGDETRLKSRLAKILTAIEELEAVDVQGVEPLYSLADEAHLRDDLAESPLGRDKILANAPNTFDGCYRVGRVVRSE